jgi:hypothetical protein
VPDSRDFLFEFREARDRIVFQRRFLTACQALIWILVAVAWIWLAKPMMWTLIGFWGGIVLGAAFGFVAGHEVCDRKWIISTMAHGSGR